MLRWCELGDESRAICFESDLLALRALCDRVAVGHESSMDLCIRFLIARPHLLLLISAQYRNALGTAAGDLGQLLAWLGSTDWPGLPSTAEVERRHHKRANVIVRRGKKFGRSIRKRPTSREVKKQLTRVAQKLGDKTSRRKAKKLVENATTSEMRSQIALRASEADAHRTEFEQLCRLPVHSAPLSALNATPGSAQVAMPGSTANATRGMPECPVCTFAGPSVSAERGSSDPASITVNYPRPTDLVSTSDNFAGSLQREKLAALRQLAYGASHEINNPLANIAMRAEMLLRTESNEDRQRKLQTIRQQAMRAHEMISDLMLFANPPPSQFEHVSLASLVGDVIKELELDCQLTGCQITAQIEPGLQCIADRTQIAEALKALLRNAMEANPKGGVIEAGAQVGQTGETRLFVRDNGPGIPADIARHMFDPFFSGREAGRGLGFGLCKAWRIAELHGGALRCSSRESGQTCFELSWPRLELAEPERNGHAS